MTQTETVRAEVFRTRDFHGWDVVDRAGEKVGTVADLLLDRGGRIRFIDVEYGLPRRHVLLPEHRLEWGDQRLIVGDWTRDGLRSLPPYDPSRPLDAPLLTEMETAFPRFYRPGPEIEDLPPGEPRVVPLAEAKDFKIEKGAPDIRGWNVFGSDGERVGTVSQLLVDPAALKVRYLDVDLLDDLFLLKDDRHVLIPLESVDLKDRGNDVWIRRLTAREVAALPAYTGGAAPRWMQDELQTVFA